jgi:hypothetical protein
MRSVTFDAHWTWAANYNNLGDLTDPYAAPGWGRDQYTTRHRAVVSTVWQLPVGKGRPFLSGAPSAVNHILGGWQLYWIAYFESGWYFTPSFSGSDPPTPTPSAAGPTAFATATCRRTSVRSTGGLTRRASRCRLPDRADMAMQARISSRGRDITCITSRWPKRSISPNDGNLRLRLRPRTRSITRISSRRPRTFRRRGVSVSLAGCARARLHEVSSCAAVLTSEAIRRQLKRGR